MEIYSNLMAKGVLNRLNKNKKAQQDTLGQIASGMNINSAKDDASAYSISEKMRTQMRGLAQCGDNTKTGRDMLAVAEGAVDNQIQVVKKLKQIALKASDDTYSQADRDTLQRETNQLLMEINDISYDTSYNGKQLLNGLVPGERVTTFDDSQGITANTVQVVPAPNGIQDGGGYGITGYGPQAYVYIPKDSSGNPITYDPSTIVTSKMVLDFTTGTLSTGSMVYDASGTAYTVTLNSGVLCVQSGSVYQPIVDNNGLNSQRIVAAGGFIPYTAQYAKNTTAPAVGTTITLTAAISSSTYTYQLNPYTYGTLDVAGDPIAQAIGSGNGYSTQPLDFGGSSLSLPGDLDDQGFSILCEGCGQFVSIKFDADMPTGPVNHYVSKTGSEAFIVGIQGVTTTDGIGQALLTGLGNGTSPVNITSSGHQLDLYAYTDPATNATTYYLRKTLGPRLCLYNGFKGDLVTTGGERPYQNIPIQGNTPASSYTNLSLPNTTLDTIFPWQDSTLDIEPKDTDYPNPWPTGNGYDALDEEGKKAKWREEVWPYPKKGAVASGSCVRTRESAQKFLTDVDQALKYLLNASTTLGAQSQRMETMNSNIVTSNENTTAAESTLRDADMAKSMTTYAKYNVLTQTAQSMLTEANQKIGEKLDLLK